MLNTLTSPGMVSASLALLLGGGRFVEISKRDVVGSARMKQDRPDVDAMMLAVDFLPPSQIQVRLRAILLLRTCTLSPPLPAPPHTSPHLPTPPHTSTQDHYYHYVH